MRCQERNKWLIALDDELFLDCRHEVYQASGPGGQKRNKKFSAIRLTHIPTGIAVISSKSRSQSENRHRALRKLRVEIAVNIRSESPEISPVKMNTGNPLFPLWIALLFDKLHLYDFALKDVACDLNISTANPSSMHARTTKQ